MHQIRSGFSIHLLSCGLDLYVTSREGYCLVCTNACGVAAASTCAISSVVLIIFARPFRSASTCSTARLMPRLKSMGFMPAATDLHPSDRMALVSTVAVVVPACQLGCATCMVMLQKERVGDA